jgi:hypothetical protein
MFKKNTIKKLRLGVILTRREFIIFRSPIRTNAETTGFPIAQHTLGPIRPVFR